MGEGLSAIDKFEIAENGKFVRIQKMLHKKEGPKIVIHDSKNDVEKKPLCTGAEFETMKNIGKTLRNVSLLLSEMCLRIEKKNSQLT